MQLLRLLSLRSLRLHIFRTLLSMFGIILGVASILAIGVTNQAAMDAVTRLFQDTSGRANLTVISTEGSGKGLPENLLRRVSSQPGVQGAAPSLQGAAVLASQAPSAEIGLNFFGAGIEGSLLLYGIDPQLDAAVRTYKVTAGRLPGQQADEVALVQEYAEENDISLNKHIELLTPTGLHQMHVIGLLAKEGPAQLNNGALGVITLDQAQSMFNRKSELDRIDIVVSAQYNGVNAIEDMKNAMSSRLGKGISVVYPASQGKRMAQMLSSYQIGLNFMSGMALFIGIFLIYNTFSMRVIERTREFGMFRTIGMTRSQVTGLILAEAGLLGTLGSALGVALGLLLSLGLARLMSIFIGQNLAITTIPTAELMTSVLAGVISTLLAAALPAMQASRISPIEALRVRGIQRENWLIRHGWIPGLAIFCSSAVLLIWNPFPYDVRFRLGSVTVFGLFVGGALLVPGSINFWDRALRPLLVGIFGSSGRLGAGNIRRARLRTTLTIAALMMGVAMTVIVNGITASFKVDLLDWINAYVGGSLYIGSSVPLRSDVWRRIEAVQGVTAATPIRYFETKWRSPADGDQTITFMAVDPIQYTQVTHFVFSDSTNDRQAALENLIRGDNLFISSVLAERYNLKEGDQIQLKTNSGWSNFHIAGVVVDFYNQGMTVTGSWNDMRRYYKISDASTVLVKTTEDESVSAVSKRIDGLYGKRYHLTLISNDSIKKQINGLLAQAFSMFDILAVIAIVVSSLGIINTLMMNVIERTKEIGMLRSIGMTREQIGWMIMAEAAVIGIAGGILGLVFGGLLARIFLQAMMAMSGYRLTFTLPAANVAISFALALIISQLAAVLPALRAARLPVLEAVHYE